MRKDGILYYYINGVCCCSAPNSNYLGPFILVYFGPTQQTYKKLDEMRFTNRAIYEPRTNYEPTAVPYDTNLALVLPDGEVPMADEYFTFVPSTDDLLAPYGLSDWSDNTQSVGDDNIVSSSTGYIGGEDFYGYFGAGGYRPFGLYSAGASLARYNGYTQVNFSGLLDSKTDSFTTDVLGSTYYHYTYQLTNCLYLPVSRMDVGYRPVEDGVFSVKNFNVPLLGQNGDDYCFSVVLADGSYSYVTFCRSVPSTGMINTTTYSVFNQSRALLSWRACGASGREPGGYVHTLFGGFAISSVDGKPLDIVYMELVQGTEPSFRMEWQTAVYSSGQLQDSPVLAVRSNLDVSTYQIGGVRPSYPQRAQVWALVENSRITSLQQYNGVAWVAVDGRIWTGSRWIPYSSFDVFTLKDLWDTVGGVTDSDYTYIYTESGFWDWWQKAWRSWTGSFDGWMGKLLAAVGGGGSGEDDDPLVSDEPLKQEDYKDIIKLLRDIYGFFSGFFGDFTVEGIENFLSFLTDGNSDMYGIFNGAGWGASQ